MSDDQFTRLFVYMEKRFDEVDRRHNELRTELKSDIDRVYGLLDTYIKRQEVYDQERLMIIRQLHRYDTWIEQAS